MTALTLTERPQISATTLASHMRDCRTVDEASELCRSMLPHFRTWAPRIARDYKQNAVADVDDVISLCAETTFHLLTDKRPTTAVDDWYRYVYGSCRHQVLAHFESAAVTAMSGMTEMMRQHRRTPADEREDAVGIADWNVAELLEHDAPTIETPDFVLSEVEGRELVQMVIEACYEREEVLGEVADAWIGSVYAEPPAVSSGADIGRQLGVTNARALALLGRVRRIAAQVCEEEFGLTGLF